MVKEKPASWLLSVGGIALDGLLVLASGLLAIQRDGLEMGAVFNPITNKLISVTDPQHAILPTLAIAAVCLVVAFLLALAFRTLQGPRRLAFFLGFVVAAGSLIVWGYISGPVGGITTDVMSNSIPTGPLGWIENASRLSGVHVVLLLSILAWVLGPRAVATYSPDPSSPTSEQASGTVVEREVTGNG